MSFKFFGYRDGSLLFPWRTVRNPQNIRNGVWACIIHCHHDGAGIDFSAVLSVGTLRCPKIFIGNNVADRGNGGYFQLLGFHSMMLV